MAEWQLVAAVASAALGAWWHPAVPWWVAGALACVAMVRRRPWWAIAAVGAVAAAGSSTALAGLTPRTGPVAGPATVWSDPVRQLGGLTFEVRVDGRHLLASAAGDLQGRVARIETGDRLVLSGRARAFDDDQGWAVARHLAGRLDLHDVRRIDGGWWPFRVANHVRGLLTSGLDSLDPDESALFRGLVIGDDRDQSDVMAFRFRASGLGHLLAVSGQNVAFVLVAAAPVLTRFRLRARWAITLGVLVLFTVVTRWEPSVLRAVAMAAVAATAALMGRAASGVRVASVAVVALVCLDPLLVRSFGFQLSVAATAALLVLARPIGRRLPGPRWIVDPLAVVLAAQIGTTPLLLLAGEVVSVASIPANLLAVPVAGWVMVWGLTAGFVAGATTGPIAAIVHAPTRAMVGWVDHVADLAARPWWPRAGGVVAVLVVAAVAAALWLPGRWRRWSLVPAVLVVALVVWPSSESVRPLGAAASVLAGASGTQLLVVGGQAQVRAVLDGVGAHGCPDAVVITSGRSRPAELVHIIGELCGPRRVIAADPSAVAGAEALVAGELRLGELRVVVSERDGRWKVRAAGDVSR